MFNARSETVAEKSVFSRLLSSKRCIVLMNGFYEWAQVVLCTLSKEWRSTGWSQVSCRMGIDEVVRMSTKHWAADLNSCRLVH